VQHMDMAHTDTHGHQHALHMAHTRRNHRRQHQARPHTNTPKRSRRDPDHARMCPAPITRYQSRAPESVAAAGHGGVHHHHVNQLREGQRGGASAATTRAAAPTIISLHANPNASAVAAHATVPMAAAAARGSAPVTRARGTLPRAWPPPPRRPPGPRTARSGASRRCPAALHAHGPQENWIIFCFAGIEEINQLSQFTMLPNIIQNQKHTGALWVVLLAVDEAAESGGAGEAQHGAVQGEVEQQQWACHVPSPPPPETSLPLR
jgi:hypothetical protein